jgi:5-methylcytosine-specific restriction endonuclease McrA
LLLSSLKFSILNIQSKNNANKSKILKENLSKIRGGICEECGNENYNILQVHHIIERCNGGTNDESNLELLCPNCHYTKHLGYSKYGE